MNNPANKYYFPNRMGLIIFLAAEEILGPSEMITVLNLAGLSKFINNYPPNNQDLDFSFEDISQLQGALEDHYGPVGGRGVALRIGRACFQHVLREFGPSVGLTNLGFRLMPLGTRLKIGTEKIADIYNQYTDQRVHLDDNGKFFLWQIERCPFCWERHTSQPVCQMSVGLIQEALHWVSGGKFFNVVESECIARGDLKCIIVIEKAPIN